MSAQECIFCKIVAGEIPAARIFEDDQVLAFLDVGPIHEGHTLIVPKTHCPRLDACDPTVLAAVVSTAGRIARAVVAVTGCDGYNCLCNNGKAAGQHVDHMHFHIIPRFHQDGVFSKWPAGAYAEGRLEAVADLIREKL